MKVLSVILLSALIGLSLVGCNDEPKSGGSNGGGLTKPEEVRKEVAANVAYLSQINASTEYGEALTEAFVKVSSLENSQVALVSGADLANISKGSLLDFYNRGGLVVVINPDANTDNYLIEELDGSYSPISDNIGAMLFAFNNRDQFFIILSKGLESVPQQEITPMDEETLNSLIGKTDEDESKIEAVEDVVVKHEHDDYHYYQRLEDFIDWVNENYDINGMKARKRFARRAGGSYNPTVDISRNYYEISYTMPVSLHNQIDKATWSSADRLDYDTNITYNAQIYPIYLHSAETQNSASGDYYIVEGTITAHNGDVWHPKLCPHGGISNRVIGYFMKELKYEVKLVEPKGNPLNGINFYREPIPTTTVQSTSYSSGFTADFNMSLSGKFQKGGSPEVGVDAGFNLSWSTTVSQTLNDVLTQRFTDSNKSVKYLYTVCNINSDRNWGDWDRKYPLLSRSDFSAPAAWIWKVPNGTNGIEENCDTTFCMKLDISATYGTFNWWRGASWDSSQSFVVNSGVQTFPIAAPSRKSFGVVALQNAGSLTVGNMVVYNSKNARVNIQGSINKSQVAKKKLKAGKYTLEYDLINPDNDNKLISRWKIENINVDMGVDEESSTTTVSTVNATKIRDY